MKYVGGEHSGHWLLGGLGIFIVAVLATAIFIHYGSATAGEPAIPSGANFSSWTDNGHGGRYVLRLIAGTAPETARIGTVTSDTQCEPDDNGINHCHNGISFDDGTSITVVNNHRMKINHCLNPGDRLTVRRLNASWIVAAYS